MAEYKNILKAGLQAAYDALETKDSSVLYFCTDTGKMYKGTVDFTNSVIAAASKPAAPITGKVYVLADTNTVEAYVGGAWKVLSYPMATTVDVNSDDVHTASAKAIYEAIQNAVADLAGSAATVKGIAASAEKEATLVVTTGDDVTSEVQVPGVVTTPTWDATARKLTLPVAGGASVEVNIGKDIFLDPAAQNGYNAETDTIDLYLNDGSEGAQGTLIQIPAAALIDIYTGEASTTASATVSADNKIKVDVKLDSDSKNAIKVTANGLMVDLSAYAIAEEVAAEIDGVRTTANAAKAKSEANESAIGIINGDATTEGSIKKAVADAVATLNATDEGLDQRVGALEQSDVTINENIAALALATTTWGSF